MNFKEQIEKFIPSNEQEKSDQSLILEYIEQFSHNILLRSNELAHITSSSIILNTTSDKILMIHHNIYNTWTWTGGHADGDTDLLEIALKEAREETGVEMLSPLSTQIASIDILPVWGHMKKCQYVSAHLHLNASYIFIADENAPLKINEEETSGVQWIPVNQLNQYSNEPEIISIYEKLIQKAKLLLAY